MNKLKCYHRKTLRIWEKDSAFLEACTDCGIYWVVNKNFSGVIFDIADYKRYLYTYE